MREAYRHLEPRLSEGNDIVITMKNVDELPSYADVAKEMEVLFSRLKVLLPERDYDNNEVVTD